MAINFSSVALSPISIDLGGKYTGLTNFHLDDVSESLNDSHVDASVIVIDDSMTFSQEGRRSRRHATRNAKRDKYAKDLILKLFEALFARDLSDDETTAIRHYMNNRGYNYLDSNEVDLSVFDAVDRDLMPLFFSDYNSNEQTFSDWVVQALEDHQQRHEFTKWKATNWYLKLGELHSDKLEFSQLETFANKIEAETEINAQQGLIAQFYALFDSDDKKVKEKAKKYVAEYKAILANALELTDEFIECLEAKNEGVLASLAKLALAYEKAIVEGHRHRQQYLQNIKHDITNDIRLKAICDHFTSEGLANLIGHISNMQWKPLHRAKAKNHHAFDFIGFKTQLLRQLKQHRHDKSIDGRQKSKALRGLIQALEADTTLKEFMNTLCHSSAVIGIPPYEARTNTGMEKDQTLLLDPVGVGRYYPNWELFVQVIERKHPELAQSLSHIALRDRKHAIDANQKRSSYILQRFLDRSKKIDPYAMRLLALGDESNKWHDYKAHFVATLGEQHFDGIMKIAKRYYHEREQSAKGIWFDTNDNVCVRSDINPPRKQSVLNILVGNIVQFDFVTDYLAYKQFIHFWGHHKVGRSTIKGLCKKIEEARKDTGNLFNEYYQQAVLNPKSADKSMKNIIDSVLGVSNAIAEHLGHDANMASKYANPYSLAQLYTILETSRDGFYKTCRAVTLENYWRSQSSTIDFEVANANRLPADSARPFDGVLARLMDRNAYEIAERKWQQIIQSSSQQVYIPICIEQNSFEFEASLKNNIKGLSKQNKLLEQGEKQAQKWQEKYQRIKDSSHNICPYNGTAIGTMGEVDHILPRSYTRKQFKTIFNGEANLIYCSNQGNIAKKEQRYTLYDLHDSYLKHQFGDTDRAKIAGVIEQEISMIRQMTSFHLLKPEQQKAVRHALFLDGDSSAFQKVTGWLQTQQKSRVNGTQKYLARRIIELLSNKCKQASIECYFDVIAVDASDLSLRRKALAEFDSIYRKVAPQPIASHAIDAYLAGVMALEFYQGLQYPTEQIAGACFKQVDLNVVKPITKYRREAKYGVQGVASVKLYKDSIYAEHFLPIWVSLTEMAVGFTPKSAVTLIHKETKKITKFDHQEKLYQALRLYADKDLPESLTAFREQHGDKWAYIALNKNTAFELLHKVAHEPVDDILLEHADMLECLRYTTLKSDIQGTLFNPQGKYTPIDAKKFEFSFKAKGLLGSAQAKMTIPAKKQWSKLIQSEGFQPFMQSGIKGSQNEFEGFLRQYFNIVSSPNGRKHATVRKVYSLPLAVGASGVRVRIRRKTPADRYIYQLQDVDGFASKGCELDNDGFATSKEVILDAYLSPNTTLLGYRYQEEKADFVYYDDWRTLNIPVEFDYPVERIEMSMGTSSRRYFRIHQKWDDFKQTLGDLIAVESPLQLESVIKGVTSLFDGEIKPRDKITLLAVGEMVSYLVEAQGQAKWCLQAYNEALNHS